MKLQSKINLVRSRINQIRESDLFSDKEKATLIRVNNEELTGYQLMLAAEKINEVSEVIINSVHKPEIVKPYNFQKSVTN
ncbi:hypothetical protein [Bizionia sp.]|uniref:hypothetical protein n=1 Tax=Bizionia sp. TaxID=1954480 RepID=UPI003A8E35BF